MNATRVKAAGYDSLAVPESNEVVVYVNDEDCGPSRDLTDEQDISSSFRNAGGAWVAEASQDGAYSYVGQRARVGDGGMRSRGTRGGHGQTRIQRSASVCACVGGKAEREGAAS